MDKIQQKLFAPKAHKKKRAKDGDNVEDKNDDDDDDNDDQKLDLKEGVIL